ncbi:hypothetical protein ACOSQ2_014206 [Xanthoceras sorbifolium]
MVISKMNINWTYPFWCCLLVFLFLVNSVWSHVEANRGGDKKSELRLIAQVTSTGIVDLDPNFESGPSTVVIDDIPVGVIRSERLKDQGGETEASILGGGILPTGLSTASRLTEPDLLWTRFQYRIPKSV